MSDVNGFATSREVDAGEGDVVVAVTHREPLDPNLQWFFVMQVRRIARLGDRMVEGSKVWMTKI